MVMEPAPSLEDLVWLLEPDASGDTEEYWRMYWPYASVSFTTVRGHYVVAFSVNPGYEDAALTLSRDAQELVALTVSGVESVTVEKLHAAEELVLRFREQRLTPLRLRLKPSVSVTWGTSLDPPRF